MSKELDDHYTAMGIEPIRYSYENELDPYQHTIIKYVTRYRVKGGARDLKAARLLLDKYIGIIENDLPATTTPEEVMASAIPVVVPGNGIVVNELERLPQLLKMIKSNEVKYERIITTGRGGLWLAANIAYALDLHAPTICSESDLHLYVHDTTLFVDSIVDTGATIENVKVDVACLVKREGSKGTVKYFTSEVPQSAGYVSFPIGQFADEQK